MKTNFMNKNLGIAVLLLMLFSVSCDEVWDDCIDGNGDKGIENRTLSIFDRMEINGDFEVKIDTGNLYIARIEADENLLDHIVTRISGDRLIIETRDHDCLKPSHPIEIIVTTSSLRGISLNGSGLVYCEGLDTYEMEFILSGSGRMEMDQLLTDNLNIDLNGSGEVVCNVDAIDVNTKISGSGEINLSGICNTANHIITGSGELKAADAETNVCYVKISGSGKADVFVTQSLEAIITGSGTVYYSGDPNIQSNITGSGRVVER